MSRQAVVATKAAPQTFAHLLKIAYFGALLRSTAQGGVKWPFALAMVVLAVVGTTLSRKALDGMTDKDFRRWTRYAVTAVGLFYLGNGVWALAIR